MDFTLSSISKMHTSNSSIFLISISSLLDHSVLVVLAIPSHLILDVLRFVRLELF